MKKRKLNFIIYTSLALAILFGIQSLFALRSNNQKAIELRDQVTEVDKNNGDVEGALQELRSYIHSHMNTSLSSNTSVYPPIQLKHTYDRLVAIEKKRVEKATAGVYEDAQKYCEKQNSRDFSGRNRVPCIQNYVTKNKVVERPIEDDLYKFDFASPVWSPDKAGFSLLATGLSFLVGSVAILVRIISKK